MIVQCFLSFIFFSFCGRGCVFINETNIQACPWEWEFPWESHKKYAMEWDGTARFAFPMNDNECQNDSEL